MEQRLTRLENVLNHLPPPASATHSTQTSNIAEDYWLERLPLLAGILGLESRETDLTRNLSEDLRRDNLFAYPLHMSG